MAFHTSIVKAVGVLEVLQLAVVMVAVLLQFNTGMQILLWTVAEYKCIFLIPMGLKLRSRLIIQK